jgi:hypothetical protein
VAAGQTAAGQRVFSLDGNGAPITSLQLTGELEAAFGPWEDFGAREVPPLIEIEAGYDTTDKLVVWALDSDGTVWMRRDASSDEWSPWEAWDGPRPPVKLVSISIAHRGHVPTRSAIVVGLGEAGAVFFIRASSKGWGAWEVLN